MPRQTFQTPYSQKGRQSDYLLHDVNAVITFFANQQLTATDSYDEME